MNLWLDGRFWGPWIREMFISEVERMRRSTFDFILPSIPDAEAEAEKACNVAWESAMSQPSDGSNSPADYADWAQEIAVESYMQFVRMHQSAVNLAAVMLWHLVEQQMLMFHTRQVLRVEEEAMIRSSDMIRDKLYRIKELHERLDAGGCSIKGLPSWPKLDELRLVANSIKHGPGNSLDELIKIRPDLITPPALAEIGMGSGSVRAWVDRPAGGEDLFVRDDDLVAYFDAAKSLWQEFSVAIEQHSAGNP